MPLANVLDRFPLDGGPYRLRDSYDAPRDGGARVHRGIDIGAPVGTLVRAPVAGRVARSRSLTENAGNLGYGVTLIDDDGTRFTFGHFVDAPSPEYVNAGDVVSPGTVIGRVGFTGNADARFPHLHFQIETADGQRVNPYPLLVALQSPSAPAAAPLPPVDPPSAPAAAAPGETRRRDSGAGGAGLILLVVLVVGLMSSKRRRR